MFKNLFPILLLLLFTSCNHNKVLIPKNEKINFDLIYIEKPFEIKWTIQKKAITKIPLNVKKKLKIICKEFNKIVLIKIITFEDNTALGTFECRV